MCAGEFKMPQLHLYVSDELAAEVEQRARKRGLSVSRYLAEVVRRDVVTTWPKGFFEEIYGGWVGEPLHRPPQGEVEAREDF
jgi:hypothetical protein